MDFIKLMLVLACMAPLFILMAIRGVGIVPWEIYFPAFIGLALIPNFILMARIIIAVKNNDRKRIRVTNSTDNREQLRKLFTNRFLPCYGDARAKSASALGIWERPAGGVRGQLPDFGGLMPPARAAAPCIAAACALPSTDCPTQTT